MELGNEDLKLNKNTLQHYVLDPQVKIRQGPVPWRGVFLAMLETIHLIVERK